MDPTTVTFNLYNTTGIPYSKNADSEYLFLPPDDVTTGNMTLFPPVPHSLPVASTQSVVLLSLLFCVIGFVGLLGNFLIIYVILIDSKMRRSVTNIFIINLAVADFLIMVFGIPDITQFMINRGWILGPVLCKMIRYILVFSLYVSVLTLVGVCIERYIAIVNPIKAHLLCSRRRILVAIGVIWPLALSLALPTALFNQVKKPSPTFPEELCLLALPDRSYFMVYKLTECCVFFLVPVLLQIVLYSIISKQLFAGSDSLHRKQAVTKTDGHTREKDSDAIKARKGVVKMLIATVVVYFLSYAPVQVPVFYNMLSKSQFKENWAFLVLIMTLGYVNSAANPILYSIFSRNFRLKFSQVLCRCCKKNTNGYRPASSVALDTYATHCKTAPMHCSRSPQTRFTSITNATMSRC